MPLPDPSPRRSARLTPPGPAPAGRTRRTAWGLTLGRTMGLALGVVATCWGPAAATAGEAATAGPAAVPANGSANGSADRHPAAQGLKLALQIDVDGQRLAAPTLWVQPGHDADITLHEQLRVAVRPQLDGDRADLRLALHTWQDGAMVLRTSPRLVTPLGQSAALTWNDGQGRTLRLQVLATMAPRPVP